MNTTLKTILQFAAGAALGFVVLGQLGTWHISVPTWADVAGIGWRPALITTLTCVLTVVFYKLTERKAFERGRVTGRIEGRAAASAELARGRTRTTTTASGIDRALTEAVKSNQGNKDDDRPFLQ